MDLFHKTWIRIRDINILFLVFILNIPLSLVWINTRSLLAPSFFSTTASTWKAYRVKGFSLEMYFTILRGLVDKLFGLVPFFLKMVTFTLKKKLKKINKWVSIGIHYVQQSTVRNHQLYIHTQKKNTSETYEHKACMVKYNNFFTNLAYFFNKSTKYSMTRILKINRYYFSYWLSSSYTLTAS